MGTLATGGMIDPRTAMVLGRVSNLPTVWTNVVTGVVLAGADLATFWLVLPLLAGSLLYVGGMYLNDAFDAEIDKAQRSDRPIPKGVVDRETVLVAGFAMLAAAALLLLLAGWKAFLAAIVLAALITLYDMHHKGNPWSPVLMGLCRFMLYITAGLAVAGSFGWVSILGAVLLLAYLVGLTYAAKQEHLNEIGNAWPLACMALPFVFGVTLWGSGWLTFLIWVGFAAWAARSLMFLFRKPRVVPKAVVSLIAGICLLDALLCAGLGASGAAVSCLLGFGATLVFQRYVPGT